MKLSNQKNSQNGKKDLNNYKNKEIKNNNRKSLKYKENSKLGRQFEEEELNNIKNKNKTKEYLFTQTTKSASIPKKKKSPQKNNILTEENLINIMNKFIDYTLNKNHKNNNNKKKKSIKYNLTNYNEETEENKENNINDNKKKRCMNYLIKRGIINEIKGLKKPKKETLKDILTKKKKSFLEEIGIEPNNITSFKDSAKENDTKNNNKKNNNNKATNNDGHNTNYYNTFSGDYSNCKSINYFSTNHNDDSYLYGEESYTDRLYKEIPFNLKPKINQFEYIRKIKKERSKIQTSPDFTSVETPNPVSKFMKKTTTKNEDTLNDSFRRKNYKKNKKKAHSCYNVDEQIEYYNNNNNKNCLNKLKNNSVKSSRFSETIGTSDEYPFSHRKNYRSPDELNKYIKFKKHKFKENEDKIIIKKNKDLFNKFKNLYTLNNNFINKHFFHKNLSPKYYNTISIKNKNQHFGLGLKDKIKENNKVLLRSDSKNSNSTLIDNKEYYINILESKKLIVDDIYSKTENNFYRNKRNSDNILKNIDEYFNKIKNKKKIIPKEKDQKEMIRMLGRKINDTLIKAKKLFPVEDSNNNNKNLNKENSNKNQEIKLNNKNEKIEDNKVNKIYEIIKRNVENRNLLENGNEIKSNEDKTNRIINIKIKKIVDKRRNRSKEILSKDENKDEDKNKANKLNEEKIQNKYKQDENYNDYNNKKELNDLENKKKQGINLNKVKAFIRMINIIIKKYFYKNLYKYYVKLVIFEHYFTGITYLKAFFKRYILKKLQKYYCALSILVSLEELMNPFLKRHKIYFLNKLKEQPKKLVDKNKSDINNKDNNFNKKAIEDKKNEKIIYNNDNNIKDDIKLNNKRGINNIDNDIIGKKINNFIVEEDKYPVKNIRENKNNINSINISEDINEDEKISIKINNKNEISRNELLINDEEYEKEKISKIKNEKLNKELKKINIDKLTDDIIKSILSSEISQKDSSLIPNKKFKYEKKIKKSRSNLSDDLNTMADTLFKNDDIFEVSGLSQISLSDVNNSIMSSYTNRSFFNKTIIDNKKYNLLFFYQKYIAPKLIKLIKNEIIIKYDRIYNNISKPYINDSENIMISLIIQDANLLRDSFKCQGYEETITEIIDKNNLLKKFEPINKKIRDYWKIKEDKGKIKNNNNEYNNYLIYDQYLNNCLIDCSIELINGERKYGENGNPLFWSSRNREIDFKYKKDNPNKLADFVCRNLIIILKRKVGLICDNYENLTAEQISNERERRLTKVVRNELEEEDYLWKNLEMEETQLKIEISDSIIDQLYSEVIEILEHIQLNRKKPELYLNKSIYGCENMPRLSFQQNITGNADKDNL